MKEYLKIKDGLYIDLEDLYEKVCIPRNVNITNEIEESIIEEEE